MPKSRTVIIDKHPGRSAQAFGIARELGTDPDLIHSPSVGGIGNKGDSQCYIGVQPKVDAIHQTACAGNIGKRGQDQDPDAPGPARVHRRNLRRHAQRHPRDALLADRTRGDPRFGVCEHLSASGLEPAPSPWSPATSRRSARSPRCSSTTGPPSSCPTDRSIRAFDSQSPGVRSTSWSRRIQAAGNQDEALKRMRIACEACPGYRQLRRDVHLQHHADLHRRGRHAAAAYGLTAVGRPAPDLEQFPVELVAYLENHDSETDTDAQKDRRARFASATQ